VPSYQFPDTPLKPSTTDFTYLQLVTAQDPADAELDVEKLALAETQTLKKKSSI
jgi:hypothetical protein